MKCAAVVSRLESFSNTQKWFVNDSYITAIKQYGWAVFPITTYASIAYAKEHCDCLISPGGYDVQGYYINEDRHEESTYYDSFLDHFDFYCIDAFVKAAKPILGICRGLQLLNIYFKGTLLSHIDEAAHAQDHQHMIHFSSHSFLSKLYDEPFMVNSFHHQVVGRLGEQLQALAYSEEMYVEALKHTELPILAVQWHPEHMLNDQLFAYFFDIMCQHNKT